LFAGENNVDFIMRKTTVFGFLVEKIQRNAFCLDFDVDEEKDFWIVRQG